jgi:hypothetical protein
MIAGPLIIDAVFHHVPAPDENVVTDPRPAGAGVAQFRPHALGDVAFDFLHCVPGVLAISE